QFTDDGLGLRPFGLDAVLQAAAAQELLHDVVEAALAAVPAARPGAKAADLVHARAAWMDRIEADARLAFEAPHDVGVGGETGIEDLERDRRPDLQSAAITRRDGAIDRPHRTGAEQAVEAIAADFIRQRRERQRVRGHWNGG